MRCSWLGVVALAGCLGTPDPSDATAHIMAWGIGQPWSGAPASSTLEVRS